MALEFQVGIADGVSKPATDAARAMAASAAQAKVLEGALRAVDVALLKASAIGSSTKKIESLKLEHAGLAAALAKVAPAAEAAAAAEAHEAAAAAHAKKAASERKEASLKSIETLGVMREALGKAAEGLHEFASALSEGDAGGAVKGLGDAIGGAAKALDLLVPGLGQLASAVIGAETAVAAFVVGTIQKLVEKSIEASEKVKLLSVQLEALGGGVSGANILGVVDDVAKKTGQARDEVGRLAKTFEGIGIHDLGKLEESLLAARSSALISASGSSQAYESLAKKIAAVSEHGGNLKIADKALAKVAETGARATDVAAKLGISVELLDAKLKAGTIKASEFGDALQKALIDKGAKAVDVASKSLDGIKARFSNSIAAIFDVGDKADPILEAFSKLADLFDQNTASGQAMKLAVETIVEEVGKLAEAAVPILKDLLLYSLQFALAVLEMSESGSTARVSFEGFALAIGGPFAGAVAGILTLVAAIRRVGPEAYEAASQFIEGLVNGIADGVSRVTEAAAKAAHAAVTAVKNVLGVHSPSVVMMDVGSNLAEGMAIGMAANDNVGSAARDMGQSAYVGAGQAAGSAPSGGSNTFNVHLGGMHIDGAGKSAEEITEESMALVLERLAAAQGLGTAA